MKKRLRRKKHVGEFRQTGFSVECRLRPGLSPGEFDQFMDDFIDHCVEAHGLLFGGGGSPEMLPEIRGEMIQVKASHTRGERESGNQRERGQTHPAPADRLMPVPDGIIQACIAP